VTVKTFIIFKKNSISNKCCFFDLSDHVMHKTSNHNNILHFTKYINRKSLQITETETIQIIIVFHSIMFFLLCFCVTLYHPQTIEW